MKNKNFLKNVITSSFLLLFSYTTMAQNINFTIDSAVDNGTDITETIVIGPDTYILRIDHDQNVEELDDIGAGDLIFYLGSGSALTPFMLTITKNGSPVNFDLNSIDYDTLGAGTISLTNQNDDIISSPTNYTIGSGTLAITNSVNAQNISQLNIIPNDNNDLNDFGFHNINTDITTTLSINEISDLDTKVEIFPNPSNGDITIKNDGVALNKITVIDINGHAILSHNLNEITTNKNLDLGSKLSSGLYFITISTQNTSVVKKLIIE